MTCNPCEKKLRYEEYENYPTWCVVNLLTSNKEDDDYWTKHAKAYLRSTPYNQYMSRDTIVSLRVSHAMAKAFVEHHPLQDEVSIYSELLKHSLQQVNWTEVAEVFVNKATKVEGQNGK